MGKRVWIFILYKIEYCIYLFCWLDASLLDCVVQGPWEEDGVGRSVAAGKLLGELDRSQGLITIVICGKISQAFYKSIFVNNQNNLFLRLES